MTITFKQSKLELERAVLACAFRGEYWAGQVVSLCADWKWESSFHLWIYESLRADFDTTREVPTPETLTSRVWIAEDVEIRPGWADMSDAFIEDIPTLSGSPNLTLRAMSQIARKDTMRRTSSAVLDAIDEGKSSAEISAIFEEGKVAAIGALAGEDDMIDWLDTAADRIKSYREMSKDVTRQRFHVPLEIIGGATRGGIPAAGRVVMIMGDTNSGKSSMAAAFGFHAAITSAFDAVVLHIVTEELKEDLHARYDAQVLRYDRGELIDGNFDEKQEAQFIRKFGALDCGVVKHLVLPMGASVHEVRPRLQQLRAKYPGRPILCIIDSPDYLNSGRRNLELRHDISAVYQTMKSWTIDKLLAPLSLCITTQVSGQWEGKLPPITGASESRDKGRIVDLGIAIRELGEVRGKDGWKSFELGINKNRIGKMKNCIIEMSGDLGTCTYEATSPIRYLSEIEEEKKETARREALRKR